MADLTRRSVLRLLVVAPALLLAVKPRRRVLYYPSPTVYPSPRMYPGRLTR